ncbi:hypothetical protein [Phenylobacterium sp.]|jgi:hypothetical protein|uniref:hypothetical protein n=1 Tax=Phenylobacterium sp. TaxID=1871053 RepID=UPI002EDA7668
MRRIEVAPLSEGWRVRIDDVRNDLVFRSGQTAEAAARRLADRLGRAGETSELWIRLRDHSLAARQIWPATTALPEREASEAAA